MTSVEEILEINILLLGESGVGKSTFINSCFNYLRYNSLAEVLANELQVLIPARISMQDINNIEQVRDLKVTDDQTHDYDVSNEVLEAGKAATQTVHSYVFLIDLGHKKCKVRFLDTPGLADERGAEQDQKNCDLILAHLAQLKNIHGLCILLKPFNSRADVMMNYCVIEILSRLEKSAVNNVAFVFTNTRGQNYKPGLTLAPLKVILEKIKNEKNLSIPFNPENTFCFDNEAFGFVAAMKNGIQLEDFIYAGTEMSWNRSHREFWRLINFAAGLNPHDLKKTITVNEARAMASNLTEPLIEIMQLIQDNISKLNQHSKELSDARLTREELLKKFHTPQIDFNVTELDSPQTVCTEGDCISVYKINGIRKIHYETKCCTECMSTFVTPEVLGNPALYTCHAFGWDGYCRVCKHFLTSHKHIYYETEVYETSTNEAVLPSVNSQAELVKAKKGLLLSLQQRQQEYENEREYILESCAIFDQYQKQNSIASVGTAIHDYLKYQITREKAFSHGSQDETVTSLQDLLARYEIKKNHIDSVGQKDHLLSTDQVEKRIQNLLNLKHFGSKIRQLYNLHIAGRKKEFTKKERVVRGESGGFFKFQDVLKIGKAAFDMLRK